MSDDPDPDFRSRLREHETALAQTMRSKSGRRSVGGGIAHRLKGAILIIVVLLGAKAALYFFAGASAYNTKLMPLTASNAFYERAIAYVMQPDPATLFVSGFYSLVAQWINGIRQGL